MGYKEESETQSWNVLYNISDFPVDLYYLLRLFFDLSSMNIFLSSGPHTT